MEALKAINEAGSGNRVATNANAGSHTNVLRLQLIQGLIGQRSRTAHDANVLGTGLRVLGNVSGSDSDIAFSGADDARAVRPKQLYAWEITLDFVEEPSLILCGHTFGDTHDELNASLGCFHNGGAYTGSGNKDAASSRTCFGYCVCNRGKDRNAIDILTCLLRVRSSHDLSSVFAVQEAVVTALASSKSLIQDLGVLIYKDAHLILTFFLWAVVSG
ncbi:unannotated protein [freshwater metagenome]|uniref:Unannotated protein n=1 Tax=freshwater metagenome TaxID=449393 RepID=A0A6J7SBK3_9ZZZZ